MKYTIRPIEPKDNNRVEYIIRSCLIEFGGNHEGTAWMDPDLGRFSEVYAKPGRAYWVVENEQGFVVGGSGIGELLDVPGTCELQKMYCLKEVRGTGIPHELIKICFDFAAKHYEKCYLETLESMIGAQRFYEKNGFKRVRDALAETGHDQCDVRYIRDL